MTDCVITQQLEGVLTIRMNRPDKFNALTSTMYAALANAIESADGNRNIKVILITGSGGNFTAGNDLKDFLSKPLSWEGSPVFRFMRAMINTDVPIIAAVEGMAIGIGTTMLLHFEQVLACERAKFSMPFANLGLVPEAASSVLLVEACGYQKAAELLMGGGSFSAAEAKDYGIVSKVTSSEDLMDEAMSLARDFASKPSDVLRATKRLMRRPPEPMETRASVEANEFIRYLSSPVAREAITAIMEKRTPDFKQFD